MASQFEIKDPERNVIAAYSEWLWNELSILSDEMNPGHDKHHFAHCGTFARSFHFPQGKDWRSVESPSARAFAVMAAAGVQIPDDVECIQAHAA